MPYMLHLCTLIIKQLREVASIMKHRIEIENKIYENYFLILTFANVLEFLT